MAVWELEHDCVMWPYIEFSKEDTRYAEDNYGIGVSMRGRHRLMLGSLSSGDPGDFARVPGTMLACTEAAAAVLQPSVDGEAEFLPIGIDGRPWYMINVVNILDCLDLAQSKLIRVKTGHVIDAENYVFREEITNGHKLFKLPQMIRSRAFATDEFRDLVFGHGFTGAVFKTPKSLLGFIEELARMGFRPPD